MDQTFFFYDLETTGLRPARDRIMQFAGQRTTMDLEPIGQPVNVLVALTDDILPSPQALLVTGLRPQQTVTDGLSELDFAAMVQQDIFTPGTIAVGFNTVRFDDEFIRHLLWRQFYDPYSWSWEEGRSRWDILDVVRMTRALRPEGIKWPVDAEGRPSNRLELLSQANGLDHVQAHDALSDIEATIAMARLLKTAQPKLFEYLLAMRDKRRVGQLVSLADPQPFVYTSGNYGPDHIFTTVAMPVAEGSNKSELLVYDCRYSVADVADLSPEQLYNGLCGPKELRQGLPVIPFKRFKANACPAVAPLSVLDGSDGWQRIDLSPAIVAQHIAELKRFPEVVTMVEEAFASRPEFEPAADAEEQLYGGGFLNDGDKRRLTEVRARAAAKTMADYAPNFDDPRLDQLLLHYKARFFRDSLSYDEQIAWGNYRHARLMAQAPAFLQGMVEAMAQGPIQEEAALLAAAEDWANSIMPAGWREAIMAGAENVTDQHDS